MAKVRTISKLHGPVTEDFLSQMRRYQFTFLCEDCAYFNEDTNLCVHEYPNEPHLQEYFERDPINKVLIFCREFELD